jgi:hypothetical protein
MFNLEKYKKYTFMEGKSVACVRPNESVMLTDE